MVNFFQKQKEFFSCAATLYPTPFFFFLSFFSFLSVHGLWYAGLLKLWGAVWGRGEPGGLGSPQTKSKLNNQTKPNQTTPHHTKCNQNKPKVSHMDLHLIKPNQNSATKPNQTKPNRSQPNPLKRNFPN